MALPAFIGLNSFQALDEYSADFRMKLVSLPAFSGRNACVQGVPESQDLLV